MKKLFLLTTVIMLSQSATMALANQSDVTKSFIENEPEEFDWHTKGYPTPVKEENLGPDDWDFEPIGTPCLGFCDSSEPLYVKKEVLKSIARDLAPQTLKSLQILV